METRTFEREGHVRLALATSDLVLEGRSFEGFPLLLDYDGWPLEPAQAFLWHVLVNRGGVESKLTWEAYGRRLYDFFLTPSPHCAKAQALKGSHCCMSETGWGIRMCRRRRSICI